MNEVIKTIYERRAVRKYSEKPVEKELIEQILDAGRMAPSAINLQPWKFYIVTTKEDIKLYSKEIMKSGMKNVPKMGVKKAIKTVASGIAHLSTIVDFLKAEDPVFHGAPLVIFITAPKDDEWGGLNTGMCAQNMMLAAKSLGLESCPVGFGKFITKTEHYSKLEIPSGEEVQLAVIIGYGDEAPQVHPRKKDNIFYR